MGQTLVKLDCKSLIFSEQTVEAIRNCHDCQNCHNCRKYVETSANGDEPRREYEQWSSSKSTRESVTIFPHRLPNLFKNSGNSGNFGICGNYGNACTGTSPAL